MSSPGTRGQAGEAAVEAASQRCAGFLADGEAGSDVARLALAAACDPKLGPDRLVRLGDLADWLRISGRELDGELLADAALRTFGASGERGSDG